MEKDSKTSQKAKNKSKQVIHPKVTALKPLKKSVKRDASKSAANHKPYAPSPSVEKFRIIREGLSYTAIDQLSKRMNTSVKSILPIFEMAQTTYNIKKKNGEHMGQRDSETVLYLNELIDYGMEVFNYEEEKFLHWLKTPNLSLGSVSPESLLNSFTGIREIKGCLDRIEYGNMA